MQKEIEATEKICNLNSSFKKKLQEYDNFKDLIVQCLEQIHKKMPKKSRKMIEMELISKNRTSKCELYFKNIGDYVS